MKTIEVSPAEMRRALGAQPRARAKRAPKAGIPRAPRQEATGLHVLIAKGWSVQSPDAVGYRLYRIGEPGMDTGLQDSELDACNRAKELSKR